MSSNTSIENSTTTGVATSGHATSGDATMSSQDRPSPASTLASSDSTYMSDLVQTALNAAVKSIEDFKNTPTSQSECCPTVLGI
jgi:hypothetical protein